MKTKTAIQIAVAFAVAIQPMTTVATPGAKAAPKEAREREAKEGKKEGTREGEKRKEIEKGSTTAKPGEAPSVKGSEKFRVNMGGGLGSGKAVEGEHGPGTKFNRGTGKGVEAFIKGSRPEANELSRDAALAEVQAARGEVSSVGKLTAAEKLSIDQKLRSTELGLKEAEIDSFKKMATAIMAIQKGKQNGEELSAETIESIMDFVVQYKNLKNKAGGEVAAEVAKNLLLAFDLTPNSKAVHAKNTNLEAALLKLSEADGGKLAVQGLGTIAKKFTEKYLSILKEDGSNAIEAHEAAVKSVDDYLDYLIAEGKISANDKQELEKCLLQYAPGIGEGLTRLRQIAPK